MRAIALRPLAGDKKDRILTKQRLMLSAAMAALLAGAACTAARADTDITTDTKSALTTSSAGSITIEQGGQIEIKASQPAVTINSNNFLENSGGISNINTATATGILVDTTAGNLVNSAGIFSVGGINLTGDGATKAALVITGGNTFFAPITFSEVAQTSTVGSTSTTSAIESSSINVQGDGSYAIFFNQGTTIDGNFGLGGTVAMTQSKNSSAVASTLIELDGNLQGNLVMDNTTHLQNIGSQARGIAILGPISACLDNASLSYTCGSASTSLIGGTT